MSPLRRFTPARIALGHSGTSLTTTSHLEFQLAHARARDAVHRQLDVESMRRSLAERGIPVMVLHSAAGDRLIYLQRPDQGRRLDDASVQILAARRRELNGSYDAIFVIADGLSARAIEENLLPFMDAILPRLKQEGWRLAPPVMVEQGRVAIGDEVGEALRVPLVVVLIGERPGLSSPDSMGIYLTYEPRVGMTDSQRNCISNVRRAGLNYGLAAHKLHYLMSEARRRKLSGVMLKDELETLPLLDAENPRSFLIDLE